MKRRLNTMLGPLTALLLVVANVQAQGPASTSSKCSWSFCSSIDQGVGHAEPCVPPLDRRAVRLPVVVSDISAAQPACTVASGSSAGGADLAEQETLGGTANDSALPLVNVSTGPPSTLAFAENRNSPASTPSISQVIPQVIVNDKPHPAHPAQPRPLLQVIAPVWIEYVKSEPITVLPPADRGPASDLPTAVPQVSPGKKRLPVARAGLVTETRSALKTEQLPRYGRSPSQPVAWSSSRSTTALQPQFVVPASAARNVSVSAADRPREDRTRNRGPHTPQPTPADRQPTPQVASASPVQPAGPFLKPAVPLTPGTGPQ
ncbi:MAG: hypothetical protein GTO53_13555 [Planctomycetales bacterium]|nr:hypothetical protein [Planctomycetales bacterium]NIM10117.1 hypothetical protein [Planctomycetales bacterium]NIN09558.1 hypothetical protein [Planctomycetales bacterium]NIN78670.1 hypothetical protein [Planctomycetales bacterium]NIO35859.1 hypothetical protein [Planctomycetales bacterium]